MLQAFHNKNARSGIGLKMLVPNSNPTQHEKKSNKCEIPGDILYRKDEIWRTSNVDAEKSQRCFHLHSTRPLETKCTKYRNQDFSILLHASIYINLINGNYREFISPCLLYFFHNILSTFNYTVQKKKQVIRQNQIILTFNTSSSNSVYSVN